MRLDSLIRLIEASDFLAFRELALECLAMKGYQQVTLTDGWKDGGTDLRVFQLPPNPTPMAFQITVEWDWKAKLLEDAEKVRTKLNLAHMTLVTSRRVPEADFQEEAERIWRSKNVRATKVDSQAIASIFFQQGRTTRILEILGIKTGTERARGSISDARGDAAYSFVFFGKETHRFREATIESAIVAVGSLHREPVHRDSFEREVQQLLQLPDALAPRVSSVVDRLIQSGDLTGPEPTLVLSPKLVDAARAIQTLRDSEWSALRDSVAEFIQAKTRVTRLPANSLDAIMSDLGALLLEFAQSAYASLVSLDTQSILTERIRERLRHLHATLDSLSIAEGSERDDFLETLAELATNSPIAKCVLSGELFLSLTTSGTLQLIRALGAHSGVQVLLEASVAIPMLCGLLFSPVRNSFSHAAHHAYLQLQMHGFSIVLPADYLEECATHLIQAGRDYEPIIDLDPDLTASENAFVSHYAALKRDGKSSAFPEYLRAFGLDDALRKADFYVARDALKPRLERLFDRYSIHTILLGRPSAASQRRAEEGLMYALSELAAERPDVLQKHDLQTIAYLHDRDRTAAIAHVLCTWDGVHFWVREHDQAAQWHVLNPAALGDILALAVPEDFPGYIASPVVLAKSLSQGAAMRGAAVWDRLVRIERGNMNDAELLAQARAFKENYISRLQSQQGTREISRAWAEWKTKHYTDSTSKSAR